MKLKITSEGNGVNTHVIDQETDKEVENVSNISITILPGKPVIANIWLTDIPIEIIGITDDHIKIKKIALKKEKE